MECECGCGQETAIATHTSKKWGVVKGRPQRFVHGHNGRRDPATRFWKYVTKSDGCWEWQGSRMPFGYGELNINKVPQCAHRLSWELHYGPIEEGLSVLHSCDNPPCVNPAHLFLGTQSDNMRDCASKGRSRNQYSISISA
jgi:hypothetical protein